MCIRSYVWICCCILCTHNSLYLYIYYIYSNKRCLTLTVAVCEQNCLACLWHAGYVMQVQVRLSLRWISKHTVGFFSRLLVLAISFWTSIMSLDRTILACACLRRGLLFITVKFHKHNSFLPLLFFLSLPLTKRSQNLIHNLPSASSLISRKKKKKNSCKILCIFFFHS